MRLDPDERAALLKSGDVSPEGVLWPSCLDARTQFPDAGPSAHDPAIDRYWRRPQGNLFSFNHRSMIPCEKRLRADSFTIIRRYPGAYLRSVRVAFAMAGYSPTPDIRIRPDNRHALAGPARVEAFLLGSVGDKINDFDPKAGSFNPGHIEWVVVLAIPVAFAGLGFMVLRRRRDPQAVVAAFMGSVLVLSTVIAQFLDAGENYRFRFVSDPILLAAVVLLYTRWRDRRRSPSVPSEAADDPSAPPSSPEPVPALTSGFAST